MFALRLMPVLCLRVQIAHAERRAAPSERLYMHRLHRFVRSNTVRLIVGGLVWHICANDAEHAGERLELKDGDAVRFSYEIFEGFCQNS